MGRATSRLTNRRPALRSRVAGWPRGLEAAVLLGLARLLVKYVPMRHWRAWLTTADTPLATFRHAPVRAVARTVRSVARRWPLNAVCLPQAMAGQWMLRRRGVASRLWFGVRKAADGGAGNASGLEYHAWLTVNGECVLGGGGIETYATLPPFDAVPRRDRRDRCAERGSRPIAPRPANRRRIGRKHSLRVVARKLSVDSRNNPPRPSRPRSSAPV